MSVPSEAKGGKSSKMPILITPALVTSSTTSAKARFEPATRRPSRAVARISTERLDGYVMTLPLLHTVLAHEILVEIPRCSESDTPLAGVQEQWSAAEIDASRDGLRATLLVGRMMVGGTWIEHVTPTMST